MAVNQAWKARSQGIVGVSVFKTYIEQAPARTLQAGEGFGKKPKITHSSIAGILRRPYPLRRWRQLIGCALTHREPTPKG